MKDFIGFDWGSAEANIQHHGQDTPPQYKLEKVNTQVQNNITSCCFFRSEVFL